MQKSFFTILVSFAALGAFNGYSTKSEWLMDVNNSEKRFELRAPLKTHPKLPQLNYLDFL